MKVIRNIISIVLMSFFISCAPTTSQPRTFNKPLYSIISKNLRVIDKRRDVLLDRMDEIDKDRRFTPDDSDIMRILRDTEYALYLTYNIAMAKGDEEAAVYYEGELIKIYKAEGLVMSRYAIPQRGTKYVY